MRTVARNGSRKVQIEPLKFQMNTEASPLNQTTKTNFSFDKDTAGSTKFEVNRTDDT